MPLMFPEEYESFNFAFGEENSSLSRNQNMGSHLDENSDFISKNVTTPIEEKSFPPHTALQQHSFQNLQNEQHLQTIDPSFVLESEDWNQGENSEILLTSEYTNTNPSTSFSIEQPIISNSLNESISDGRCVSTTESLQDASKQSELGLEIFEKSTLSTIVNKNEPQGSEQFSPNMNNVSVKKEPYMAKSYTCHLGKTSSQEFMGVKAFIKIIPLFNSINKNSYGELLVQVLRECLHFIPLDDFYYFIYNPNGLANVEIIPVDGTRIDGARPTGSKMEAFKLCRLILESFSEPNHSGDPFSAYITKDILLSSLKMHEVLRVFLTIKIIFDSIQVVENDSKSDYWLTRTSIYKVYLIVCNQLIQKFPVSSNSSEIQKNIRLSHSQFGKVFRMSFPNLQAKRGGKRGSSKFGYQGVKWNSSLIDDSIQNLAKLSFQEIDESFFSTPQKRRKEPQQQTMKRLSPKKEVETPAIKANPGFRSVTLASRKPLYSFVDLSNTFPGSYCFLRVWKCTPGTLPQQSQWSKETMQKSVEALKEYDIDLAPCLLQLQQAEFSKESMDCFLDDVLLKMSILVSGLAGDQGYLHLYLVVSLLISPIAFSSQDEVKFNPKAQFCTSLTKFVTRLETECTGISFLNRNNLMGFAKIIKKLISAANLLLARVKSSSVKSIVEVMGDDLTDDPLVVLARNEERAKMLHRGVITACNSLNWEFVEEPLRANSKYQTSVIHKMTISYIRFCDGCASVTQPPNFKKGCFYLPTYDLPSKIFIDHSQVFHEVFMSDEFVLQLPVKLIELLVNSVVSELQTNAFHHLGKVDRDLSKEIYKTWWIFSTAVQEYMSVLSEIVALSIRVS